MSNVHEYATTDLYLAAYLQAAGAALLRTDKAGNGPIHFVLDASVANIPELKNAYYNSSGRVAAIQYANNIKNLKHLCHIP